jgi:arylformamidase
MKHFWLENTGWGRCRALSGVLTALLALGGSLGVTTEAPAGPLRDALAERRATKADAASATLDDGAADASRAKLPAGVKWLRDVPYGPDPLQRMDVYLPTQGTRAAPVIFMVHGGGWRIGDKTHGRVVTNKVARWVPGGVVLVSVNYRMVPAADPRAQAQDVARALAKAQSEAAGWGADPAQFVLMGHSAGAHLVALLTASPALAADAGAQPWRGTVALDSAAFDVPKIMESRHPRLYDQAFGSDPVFWRAASPLHQLPDVIVGGLPPLLAVCSSRRSEACPQAQAFAAAAQRVGLRTQVMPQDLSHGAINQDLGLAGSYTEAVEAFMRDLSETLKRAFQP